MIVDNLKRTKARSNFIRKENLGLNIYKFHPIEHLELVVEGAKTRFGKEYEEFKARESELHRKMDEERKAKELAAKKNKPLQGNLALNFLFKDQDISEIMKLKG